MQRRWDWIKLQRWRQFLRVSADRKTSLSCGQVSVALPDVRTKISRKVQGVIPGYCSRTLCLFATFPPHPGCKALWGPVGNVVTLKKRKRKYAHVRVLVQIQMEWSIFKEKMLLQMWLTKNSNVHKGKQNSSIPSTHKVFPQKLRYLIYSFSLFLHRPLNHKIDSVWLLFTLR